MNNAAVMEQISKLENRVQRLNEDNQNLTTLVTNCEEFLKRIPKSLPGGSKDALTPNEWLDWALKELGYDKAD